jgi:sugar/nucleoside kinase (ribokinase family)
VHLDPGAVAAAARDLLDRGVREWVVVHFPEGACAAGRGAEVHWQPSVALPPAFIVGANGAGDAFAAGTLLGLHQDWPLPQCLEAGVAAAAASLGHASCSEGIDKLDTCLAAARQHGFRLRPAGGG